MDLHMCRSILAFFLRCILRLRVHNQLWATCPTYVLREIVKLGPDTISFGPVSCTPILFQTHTPQRRQST